MVLLHTVQGARVTQSFGPSALGIEPTMYSTGDKAYWLPYFGASLFDNFHPGIDRAASTGTPVRAMEDGTVAFAGWLDNISGNQIVVEIRPNTRYSVNHLSVVKVRVGQRVEKAQTIGLVGSTGASTGPHTHEGVSIREEDPAGVFRTFLYNPALFQSGGALAGDSRIQPVQREVQLNGPGINIRRNDGDLFDRDSIYAVSKSDGIYRVGTGRRLGPLGKRFPFLRWRVTDEGTFAVVTGFGRQLAIRRTLVHFA
jgi:murein DD-endopeptidase MepM/ murein hydrolase activator NlpD